MAGWRVLGVDNVDLRLAKLQEVADRDKCQVTTLCLDLEPDLAPDLGSNEPDWEGLKARLLTSSQGGYLIIYHNALFFNISLLV